MASLSQSCEHDCFLVSSHLRISNASLCTWFELKNSSCCLFANNVSLMLSVFPCSYLVSFLSYSMFPPCYPGSLPCYPIVLMFSFLNSLNVDRCVMFGGSQKFFFAWVLVSWYSLLKNKAIFNFIILALLLKNSWSNKYIWLYFWTLSTCRPMYVSTPT